MNLKEIELLAKNDKYDQALDKCDNLIKNFPKQEVEILRTRAYVFSRKGDYENALKDRRRILASDEANIKDYYLSGNNALSIGLLEDASNWFQEVLRIGKEQNEAWFESAVYFFLAYIQMELGFLNKAKSYLDNAVSIDPNCSMPLPGLGFWNAARLNDEILHRTSTKK